VPKSKKFEKRKLGNSQRGPKGGGENCKTIPEKKRLSRGKGLGPKKPNDKGKTIQKPKKTTIKEKKRVQPKKKRKVSRKKGESIKKNGETPTPQEKNSKRCERGNGPEGESTGARRKKKKKSQRGNLVEIQEEKGKVQYKV